MIYRNILVPYDRSIHAAHALRLAVQQVADDPDATITVLFVVEASNSKDVTFAAAARMAGVQTLETNESDEMEKDFRDEKCREIEKEVEPLVANAPNRFLYKVATGRPHHAILNYTYDHGCDLIVMGCRGLNALQGMMGSVSAAVVRLSTVPVLVVK
ncbi:MAG: universal stress protein [Eggerthellaceae bacterium]|jgi:nucleotide-binding universal stress UspA family protein